jgi:hypothetical protein
MLENLLNTQNISSLRLFTPVTTYHRRYIRQTMVNTNESGYLSRCSDGLRDRPLGVRFLVGARDFSLLHSVQIGSVAHPAC